MSQDIDPRSFIRVPAGVWEDPQFLRKYELERELGVGGAGSVFCARHRDLDERVAIKFLHAGSDNTEAMARFRREARAANRVKSEHVVRIIDVSTTQNGVPYVVMEYLEGTDLERLLLESPDAQLPVRDAVEFVLQACEALAECHAIGIVHRDLKPSNLFCTHGADGLPIIKVLDFGISKLGTVTIDEAMTGRHAIMGSPRYMSPEQFATPTDVDYRTDIWALGVMLYELVTGRAPFGGSTLIAIWESVKQDVPKPIEELRRDAPRGLGAVILRCLEKDRDHRFQNVAELAKALLPLSPERCRATVARIVRIVEAPGVSTESLSLPPSVSAGRSSNGGASVSVHGGTTERRSVKNYVWVALMVAAGTGAGVYFARPPAPPAAPPPVEAVPASTTPPVERNATAPAPNVTAPIVTPEQLPPPSASESAAPPRIPAIAVHGPATPRARPSANPAPSASVATVQSAAPAEDTSAAAAAPTAFERSPSRPVATASGSKAAAAPSSSGGSSPFIVDIVEKRKRGAGATP